ncbi:MAG: outer membrane beta-barrel protein [Verrucomicrobia bacterium]|jgi:hypothetical protein|nr:outer membrane beta-barrel protein [Verrucomicrobiota bacterium]
MKKRNSLQRLALICALLASFSSECYAADATSPSGLGHLEAENIELRSRLEALEKRLGMIEEAPAKSSTDDVGNILMDSKLSGFVMASYFYDTSDPADGTSNGLLWNDNANEFTINKIKVTLENPATMSPSEWDVGYHISAMFGADSRFLNSAGGLPGMDDIRQAYLDINVPVGEGLNVKAGQLISLWNFESGDGGAVNPNFSQGNQWFFTGNPPGTGVQVSHPITDGVDFTLRLQNGFYSGATDGNDGKTVLSSIGFKPTKSSWVKLNGVAGEENAGGGLLSGGQMLAGVDLGTDFNLQAATELSYLTWESASVAIAGDRADALSAGVWLWGDFSEKFGFALRGDVVADRDGGFTSGLLGFPANPGQDLYSATFTLNYRPISRLKIQPEIRYDSTSFAGGFDGEDDRWTFGVGASYLF